VLLITLLIFVSGEQVTQIELSLLGVAVVVLQDIGTMQMVEQVEALWEMEPLIPPVAMEQVQVAERNPQVVQVEQTAHTEHYRQETGN
jgi:hypothetical protein